MTTKPKPEKVAINPGDIVEVTWEDHWWDQGTSAPDATWDEEWLCYTVGVVVENTDRTLAVAHEWSPNNWTYRGVTHILKATVRNCYVYGQTDKKIPTRDGVVQRV